MDGAHHPTTNPGLHCTNPSSGLWYTRDSQIQSFSDNKESLMGPGSQARRKGRSLESEGFLCTCKSTVLSHPEALCLASES